MSESHITASDLAEMTPQERGEVLRKAEESMRRRLQNERSALVALTEAQILWLKKVLAEMARKTGELGYKKWDGMPLEDIDRIVEQMRVAAYALQREEGR